MPTTSRRKFLTLTSAGLSALAVAPGRWTIARPASDRHRYEFTPYRPGKTLAPVLRVTPDDGAYAHTYYDVCPWSASGRLLGVTRFPFQDRTPAWGDAAEVCVIDLEEQTIETVYTTRVWGYQLGANVQWGPTDRYLYTNDVVDGDAVGVRIDLESGETMAMAGPKYDIAPDGSALVGPDLELMNRTQYGYGLPDDPDGAQDELPPGASDDTGIWRTDLETNEKSLLVSLADAAAVARPADPDAYDDGTFYFWHCKYNRQNTRVMQVLRCVVPGHGTRNPTLLTYQPDGGDIRLALDRTQWAKGGHPNWHPDGRHIVAHLVPHWLGDDTMRFCLVPIDGGEIRVLAPSLRGGGHPSIEQSGRHLVTDAYPRDPEALPNGEVPLRLIDLQTEEERRICTVFIDLHARYDSRPAGKLDPHPAWSRDYRSICFNGAPEGRRQIFIADLSATI
ncbi:MAG: hypothetical protein WD342_10865 [Verrucomicrobiales bacterium]